MAATCGRLILRRGKEGAWPISSHIRLGSGACRESSVIFNKGRPSVFSQKPTLRAFLQCAVPKEEREFVFSLKTSHTSDVGKKIGSLIAAFRSTERLL
jgi:hypothetical protein